MGDPDEFGGGPPDDGPPDGFFGDDGFDDGYGPPGGSWGPPPGGFRGRGRGGFRGGPPPRFMRGGPRGGFRPHMRGRGGFGPPPNGFGPPGGPEFRPRGPPPHGWPHGPPGDFGGPPMGPPGHWGGPPGGQGWDEDGPPPGMEHERGPEPIPQQGPPKDVGVPGDQPPQSEDVDVDLNGEVWVETKSDNGKSYYYNAQTRATTWDRPEEKDGVRVLTQEQVDKLAQKLSEKKQEEHPPQQQPNDPFGGMPPPHGYPPHMSGPPPGYPGPGPGGHPPPGFIPPHGYPPPWAMGGQGGPPPQGWGMPQEVCDWTEHTAPDGKKYYYNSKSGQSIWEKPKELIDFEQRQNGPPPVVSAPATMTKEAEMPKAVPEPVKSLPPPKMITTPIEIKAKPADKSRPVSSTPVHGTPWCVVWTGDNKAFFYNPSTKTSVWERPPDLIGRADVTEMLRSPAAAEKVKSKSVPPGFVPDQNSGDNIPGGGGGNRKSKKNKNVVDSDADDAPPAVKKKKVELVFEDEMKANEAANSSNGNLKSSIKNKDAAMEAEVKAARERQLVPLEKRMTQFRELLLEKDISAFSTWEKELHKIVFDPRYLLLTSKERKTVFEKYVRERADEERREKKNRLREAKDNFLVLLKESNLSAKMTYSEFAHKHSKDDRFKGIEKSRERESLFNDFMVDIKKKDKEERVAKREAAKKEFFVMLKEFAENPDNELDRHTRWIDVKKKFDSDSRYKNVDSSGLREDYFMDFVHDLKEEHRKKKKEKKRSRSKSPKGRDRSRSRSRRHSRSRSPKKKSKKDKRDKSKDRDDEESRKDKKKNKKDKDFDREEGEMSEDSDYEHRRKDRKDRKHRSQSPAAAKNDKSKDQGEITDDDGKGRANGTEDIAPNVEEDLDPEEREKRDREERIAASLRKREEEVAKELSGHLHAREKEREQHRKSEAVSAFQALLTDLIKHPDYSWKEAKKIFKKDSRYDNISDNLEKSERERLFDEHIDLLVTKKKENYRKLLDECKAITLDSSFKDIKKLIKEDPRYSRYSSSERKCEKQFNEYMKDRSAKAKAAFRQLLMETRFITDKSLQLVRDKDSGHLAEIEELLKKDRRYLDLEVLQDDRKSILYTFMEEMEKKGPAPPPTASEPSRRGGAP